MGQREREVPLEEVLKAILQDWKAQEATTPHLTEEAIRFWASAEEVPPDVEDHLQECGQCGILYMDRVFEAAGRKRWEALQDVWEDPAGLLKLVADRGLDSMIRLMACERLKEVGDASVVGRLRELREEEMDPAVDKALQEAIEHLGRPEPVPKWWESMPGRVREWLESLVERVVTVAWGEVELEWVLAAAGPSGVERVLEVTSPDGRVRGKLFVGPRRELTLRVETEDEDLRGRRVKVWLGGREVGEGELVGLQGERRYGCGFWLGRWTREEAPLLALAVVGEDTDSGEEAGS